MGDDVLKRAIDNLKRRNSQTADKFAINRAVVTIKIFGIGGGGGNVLKRLAEGGLTDTELVAVNTDVSALNGLNVADIKTVQIGERITKGKGTGGDIALGEQAAREDSEKLRMLMSGADMIFITTTMGGGTGTGAAPIVAKIAKEQGILTVGVVTVPFKFEGIRKLKRANEGVVKMQSYMDALVVIKNDNLMKLPENKSLSIVDAFHSADDVLRQAIKCIAELVLTIGFINVDFADVTTIFQQSESSDALLGIGRSNISAVKAVQQAIESPLIDRSLQGARGMILNITGDESLSLYDVNEAADFIYSQTAEDVNIIFGAVVDKTMNGVVQATIIATDFIDSLALKSPTVTVPKSTVTVSKGFNFDAQTFPEKNSDEKGAPVISSFDFLKNRRK